MRSERKCSIFDLLWPDPSIPEGESEKFVFLENNNIFEGKKIYSLSYLTRIYLCVKIETIWVFDPWHKNFIFVWFLHGCPLKLNSNIFKKHLSSAASCISLSNDTQVSHYWVQLFSPELRDCSGICITASLRYLPELEIQGAIFEGNLSDKIPLRNERNCSGRKQEGILFGGLFVLTKKKFPFIIRINMCYR